MNKEDWVAVYLVSAILVTVAICTASVAYWAQSSWGLLSMTMLLFVRAKIGETSRRIAIIEAETRRAQARRQ